jgi:hypothetical protein
MVPYAKATPSGSGLGDVVLNYRYQAVLTERLAVAPRLSLALPTGRCQNGYGTGGSGLQAGIPVSAEASRNVTVHLNAGATWTPRAAEAVGVCRATVGTSAGASAVIRVSSTPDTFVEVLAGRVQSVQPDGTIQSTRAMFLNPGVRFAINRPSGLQIVPGIAYTIGVGPSSGSRAIFLYLSFEHPLPCLTKRL